jgi:hypothetical protein
MTAIDSMMLFSDLQQRLPPCKDARGPVQA